MGIDNLTEPNEELIMIYSKIDYFSDENSVDKVIILRTVFVCQR